MNEFTAKKLAEVQAFLTLSGVIVDRAGTALAEAQPDVVAKLTALAKGSVAPAVPAGMESVFTTKVDKTKAKLTSMMELYVGDEWDNPVEVLEWSSFFTGAAAAHCALASELDPALHDQLDRCRADFEATLQAVITALRATGHARADQ